MISDDNAGGTDGRRLSIGSGFSVACAASIAWNEPPLETSRSLGVRCPLAARILCEEPLLIQEQEPVGLELRP